jgi:hypothetical protein
VPIPADVSRALAPLDPNDPIRHLVRFAAESDEPAVVAAIVRRLVTEIQSERGGSSVGATSTGEEVR